MLMNLKHEDYLRLCSRGDLNSIKEYFKDLNREQIESIRDEHKASCLHYATRNGFVNVLDYLINTKNVSPFLVSEIGATCLHDAAVKGRIEVIKWLLSNTSLTSSFKDANGATIIHLAAKFDNLNLIEWLIELDGVKCVKALTFNGATCLHFAASTNSFNSLRRLLQCVPNYVNSQMINGVTPVYLAVQENNITMVKYLVKYGANVNIRAEDGMNSIHVACQNGNLDMVQFLHDELYVNLNEKDYNGATPLHYACLNGNSKLVAYLLNHGARILIDKFGNSPLHDSAVGGHIECARLLIANGCDCSLKDNDNMTCSQIAESNGFTEYSQEIKRFEKAILQKNQENIEPLKQSKSELIGCPTPNRSLRKSPSSNSILNNSESKQEKTSIEIIHQGITSPIFNSLAVVSTSTPSSTNELNKQEEERLKINNATFIVPKCLDENDNSKCFININKPTHDETRVSALEELDKCIAEFETKENNKIDNNSLSLTVVSDISKENSSLFIQSPDANNNRKNLSIMTLPNKLPSSCTVPPPPPPLPSTWSTLDKNQSKSKTRLNDGQMDLIQEKSKCSINYIDELQIQLKNNFILKKKSSENKINTESDVNSSENSIQSVRKLIEMRALNKQSEPVAIPEWKKQLLERKKNRLSLNI